MTWALKLEDKNFKKNLELKIYTGKKPRCMSALAHILWWYSLGLDPLLKAFYILYVPTKDRTETDLKFRFWQSYS